MKGYAYARFSSDNQREESIDAQFRAIREYAEKNGITIVEWFSDEAMSARTDNRPSFQKMFSNLDVDCIIVHKLDRFSRDRYDSAFYRRELKKKNVRLISVLEPLDDSPESVILESVLEGMAEYYSKNLARETLKGLKETAYKCRFTGGNIPLGYDVVDGVYQINEREAELVRLIFRMYASGEKYSAIVSALEGEVTKAGKPFTKTSLNTILHNKKYAGIYFYGRTAKHNHSSHRINPDAIEIEDGIPAIVPSSDWEAAQKRLTSASDNARYKTRYFYMLSGKLKCECGTNMYGFTSVRKGHTYSYYKCPTCGFHVRADEVEDYVIRELMQQLAFTDEEILRIYDKITNPKYQSAEERKNTKELESVRKKINSILSAIKDGLYDPSLVSEMKKLQEREHLLSKDREIPSLEDVSAFLKETSQIQNLSPEEQKAMIQRFVSQIKKCTNHYEVSLCIPMVAGTRNLPYSLTIVI